MSLHNLYSTPFLLAFDILIQSPNWYVLDWTYSRFTYQQRTMDSSRFVDEPEIGTLAITFLTYVRKVMSFSFHNINKIIWFIASVHCNVSDFANLFRQQTQSFFTFSGIFLSQPTLSWQNFCKISRSSKTNGTSIPSGSYTELIVDSISLLVSGLSLRFWNQGNHFWCSNVHLVHVQLVDHQYLIFIPLSSDGVFLLQLLRELLCCC